MSCHVLQVCLCNTVKKINKSLTLCKYGNADANATCIFALQHQKVTFKFEMYATNHILELIVM